MAGMSGKAQGGEGGSSKAKSGKLLLLLQHGERFLDLICSGRYDPSRDVGEQLRELQQLQQQQQVLLQQQQQQRQQRQRRRQQQQEELEGEEELEQQDDSQEQEKNSSSSSSSSSRRRRGGRWTSSVADEEGEEDEDGECGAAAGAAGAAGVPVSAASAAAAAAEVCVPSCVLLPPKPHQVEGLRWLARLHAKGLSGLLADEMGLGKTYQTIAFLGYLQEYKHIQGPHLILAPKSTIGNWMAELRRFCPSLGAVKILGEKEKRKRLLHHLLFACKLVKETQQQYQSRKQQQQRQSAAAAAARSRAQSPLLERNSSNSSGSSSKQQQREDEEPAEEDDGDEEASQQQHQHHQQPQQQEKEQQQQQQQQQQQEGEEEEPVPETVSVVVASYEMLMAEKNILGQIEWQYIIIDEAHRIKNEAGKLATTVRQFSSKYRLLLTGTPLQVGLRAAAAAAAATAAAAAAAAADSRLNNLRELWALLHFLLPQLFESGEDFLSLFDLNAATDEEGVALTQQQIEERNLAIVNRLHRILRPFMLRRVKKDVLQEMPPKKEVICFVPLSAMQRTLYRDLLTKNVAALQGGEGCGKSQLRNLAVQLRKACNHPYLFEGYEPEGEDPFGEHVILNSGKLRFCDCLLQRLIAGGTNLTAADTVIIYDSDWNPQADLQAMDRAHRIGQQRAVNVYRLIHEHTVEEKVLERANLKLQLDTAVIQQGRLHEGRQRQPEMSASALLKMVQFGAEHIFKPAQQNELTEEELDAILARGQERTEQMHAMLQQQVRRSLLDFSSSSSSSSSSLYEADDLCYPEERKAADREAWAAIAQEQLAASAERDSRRRLRGSYKDAAAAAAAEQQQQQQQQNNKERSKPAHIPRIPKLPTMQVR
ncbi:SWI/SNF-related matrix-associated actin-dependent regulator of chromatin, putative [Eimeria acervulina]|uniref:SWI/SNF-related matrix-associated actin-dependent regulator of chromatin, putative n=1 Tax=Eimeria acervulina TaxID=5801 RepID=U6GCG5_EIMAC|nr:SWI/SNF-related matrix-associated actin-dependent regulator of chromatin, putative [Eimeria acervulina]CDI77835.1 SWI/SNF-related matrix-associated actin-dependent regulator of chromatin, putative [Eimeria acervulina]